MENYVPVQEMHGKCIVSLMERSPSLIGDISSAMEKSKG